MLQLGKLGIGDHDFLVASLIERCPKTMMLRELLTNALEAAGKAPPNQRRVMIGTSVVNGVSKLKIWNSGPGMNAEELFRMCDIASSIGKEHGLDRNFGMGAKVAALPSNQHGIRYRSCHAGRVHEILIGKRQGVYGRLPLAEASADPIYVINSTDAAQAEGLPTDQDWTEVLLLGNAPEQNTLLAPYGGNPGVASNWLITTIHDRFFDFDPDTQLWLAPEIVGATNGRPMLPLRRRLQSHYCQHQSIETENGIRIHYLLHAPQAALPPGEQAEESLCAVVHHNEMYDVRRGAHWTLIAPAFGVSFGSRQLSVLVELPETAAVRPDGYRQFLRYTSGSQDHIRTPDFAASVRECRPPWVHALIAGQSPDRSTAASISDQLSTLLCTLGLRRRHAPHQAQPPARPHNPPQPAPGSTRTSDPTHAAPAPPPLEPEPSPELLLLRDAHQIAERHLRYRAARYYPETHQLFINLQYPAIAQQQTRLLELYPQATEGLSEKARELAEYDMMLRIGRALVLALAKRDLAQGWNEHEKQTIASSEVLSIAADDIYSTHPQLEEKLQQWIAESACVKH